MSQHGAGKVAWTEIVGSIPFSERRLMSTARRYFAPSRFVSAGNQAKRSLIRGLIRTAFDPNLSIVDLGERIEDGIRGSAEAKVLESCIAKIWKLGEEGWHVAGENTADMVLHWDGLQVQLRPEAMLLRAGETCFLYTYFRKTPVLSTDGVRALIALVRALGRCNGLRVDHVVVLDCFKDAFYESADFEIGETWIANRMGAVIGGYAEAFRSHRAAALPREAPRADAVLAGAMAQLRDGTTGRADAQFSFRLH